MPAEKEHSDAYERLATQNFYVKEPARSHALLLTRSWVSGWWGVGIVAAFYSQNIPLGVDMGTCQALTRFQSPNKLTRTRLDVFLPPIDGQPVCVDELNLHQEQSGRESKKWPFLRGKIQECVALVCGGIMENLTAQSFIVESV